MEGQSLLTGGLVVWGIALAVAVLVGVYGVGIYRGNRRTAGRRVP